MAEKYSGDYIWQEGSNFKHLYFGLCVVALLANEDEYNRQ